MTRHEREALCDQELSRIVLSEFNRAESMLKRQSHPGKDLGSDAKATVLSEQHDAEQDSELLDDEEQRFIAQTVAWLRTRKNKDAILAGIRSSLIEEHPDAFSQPEEEGVPDESVAATDAGAEDQDRPEHE